MKLMLCKIISIFFFLLKNSFAENLYYVHAFTNGQLDDGGTNATVIFSFTYETGNEQVLIGGTQPSDNGHSTMFEKGVYDFYIAVRSSETDHGVLKSLDITLDDPSDRWCFDGLRIIDKVDNRMYEWFSTNCSLCNGARTYTTGFSTVADYIAPPSDFISPCDEVLPSSTPKPEKKNNTIIIIVVVLVIVLIGVAIAVIVVVMLKKKKSPNMKIGNGRSAPTSASTISSHFDPTDNEMNNN
ncbi:hypothetical protein SNEBB_005710 [Seison nebaliae]|nr:hypothetical protein SNEBB_005710 [Seison nebaliae]